MPTRTEEHDYDGDKGRMEPAVERESMRFVASDGYMWVYRNCRWVCMMFTEATLGDPPIRPGLQWGVMSRVVVPHPGSLLHHPAPHLFAGSILKM
jgi:hypothetical protein